MIVYNTVHNFFNASSTTEYFCIQKNIFLFYDDTKVGPLRINQIIFSLYQILKTIVSTSHNY
jgi:hypothetical protein